MNNELDWVGRWAIIEPYKIAITDLDTGEEFSFRQLNEYANRLFNYLRLHYKEGDRVAVLSDQSPFLVALMVACQRLGIILVPINFRLSGSEILDMLHDSAPGLLIYSQFYEAQSILAKDHMRCLSLVDFLYSVNENPQSEDSVYYELKMDSALFLFYSSGTTSKPKGVVYTNKMLFWNSLNTSMQLEITSRDSTINILPPYHTSGWNVLVTPLLHQGGHIAMMRKFDAQKLLLALERLRSTVLMSLPTVLQMLSQHEAFLATNLPYLRYIITGGEVVPLEVVALWNDKKDVAIRPGYGLTEAGPSITSLHQDLIFKKRDSIGKPNFYVDIEIRNHQSKVLSVNEVGELCIRSKVVTPGYWNNSVLTRNKIKDGWLHTGDLATMDEEGFIFLKGRMDDMYISGGENIYPKEIEIVIKSFNIVQDVLVLPIADSRWGNVGVAFIKSDEDDFEQELKIFLSDKLAKYKHPQHYIFLKKFPITGFGKVSRKDLYQLLNAKIFEPCKNH